MKRRIYCNHKGFTLVELVISIGIMGIVALFMFSFFDFNLKAYAKGEDAANEQANLRLLSYKLTDQLRNIGYIDLGNSTFANPSEIAAVSATDSFIFKGGSNVKKGDASGISVLADDVISDIDFSIRKSGEKYFLGITVTGEVHSYTTEVLLNNIVTDEAVQMDSGDIGLSGFSSIRFNYNLPPAEDSVTPTVPPEEDETDPLDLVPPASLEVLKGTEFVYEAEAFGGVPPYTYVITVVHPVENEPFVIGNRITWDAPNQPGKIMKFNVTVTDSDPEVGTISVQFIITTVSHL